MIRRVERIVANAMRERAEAMTDAIVWAGTFHAVGARLLREYAEAMVWTERLQSTIVRIPPI
jgi:DNA helicase II / ATP-dependent DNA helicase PcrA